MKSTRKKLLNALQPVLIPVFTFVWKKWLVSPLSSPGRTAHHSVAKVRAWNSAYIDQYGGQGRIAVRYYPKFCGVFIEAPTRRKLAPEKMA